MQIPDPTPTLAPNVTLTPEQIANTEKQFLATIQGVNANILQILPAGSDTTFNLDMSAIPAYFKGGIAPGSHVNVTYIGDLQTDPFEAVRIIAVTGEDPDTMTINIFPLPHPVRSLAAPPIQSLYRRTMEL